MSLELQASSKATSLTKVEKKKFQHIKDSKPVSPSPRGCRGRLRK